MSVALADIETEEKPDSELVQACLDGDQHSFRLLYQRYQQKVRSTLYQLCGSTTLDDLVQEVFLRAWKGLPKEPARWPMHLPEASNGKMDMHIAGHKAYSVQTFPL